MLNNEIIRSNESKKVNKCTDGNVWYYDIRVFGQYTCVHCTIYIL